MDTAHNELAMKLGIIRRGVSLSLSRASDSELLLPCNVGRPDCEELLTGALDSVTSSLSRASDSDLLLPCSFGTSDCEELLRGGAGWKRRKRLLSDEMPFKSTRRSDLRKTPNHWVQYDSHHGLAFF